MLPQSGGDLPAIAVIARNGCAGVPQRHHIFSDSSIAGARSADPFKLFQTALLYCLCEFAMKIAVLTRVWLFQQDMRCCSDKSGNGARRQHVVFERLFVNKKEPAMSKSVSIVVILSLAFSSS